MFLVTSLMTVLGELTPGALVVGCVVGVLSALWWRCTRRPSGIPPGPGFALPLLGHLHLLEKNPRGKYHQWRKQYGDIFSLYVGSRLVIIFCGYPVLKEAFIKMANVFSDRPKLFLVEKINQGRGIVNTSGPAWKEQRKTSLEILRELGMGKNVLAEKIQEEVSHYIRTIEEFEGQATDLRSLTSMSVSNNISSILFGQRSQYDDPEFIDNMHKLDENFKRFGGAMIINFLQFLRYLPGDLFGLHKMMDEALRLNDIFFNNPVRSHVALSPDGDHEASDFIFAYLRQMKKKEQQGAATSLCEAQLQITVCDLFVAGTETTTTIITWALLVFLHYPHVQDACYREICDVIGTHRMPAVRDRAQLVYVEATINEVLRFASILPFGLQHSTSRDVTFRGYVIPKDAIILPFMDTVFFDEHLWGDPHTFRPERFIGEDGKLVKPDEFVPFFLGRRACLGEALARMELFLYLCTLIQRFRFLPAEPEVLPPIRGILGVTCSPEPYKIRAVRRE